MGNYYPPVSFYFEVKIAGFNEIDGNFAEVSGLDSERGVVEVKEGGENRYIHRLPDRAKSVNLVMRRGLVLTVSRLFDWCKENFESDLGARIEVKDVEVSLLEPTGSPVMTWSVKKAWPVKWSLGAFNATENAVAMESIELAYSHVDRKRIQDLGPTGFFGLR